jgi:hypothetical protein
VFPSLNDVIGEHGPGDEGWRGVRWEVYDKVCFSCWFIDCNLDMYKFKGAIEYFTPGCSWDRKPDWFDDAFVWLEGKLDGKDYGFQK